MPSFSNIILATGITLFSLAMVRDVSGSPLNQEENAIQEQGQGTSSGSVFSGYTQKDSYMRNQQQHVKRQWWHKPMDFWA